MFFIQQTFKMTRVHTNTFAFPIPNMSLPPLALLLAEFWICTCCLYLAQIIQFKVCVWGAALAVGVLHGELKGSPVP